MKEKLVGDGYVLDYDNGKIRISGKLSLMLEDYMEIETFFEKIIASMPKNLLLDIRDLEYLNSSGIKVICVNLILEAANVDGLALKIRCSDHFTWQKETIPTFQDLMTNMTIAFE